MPGVAEAKLARQNTAAAMLVWQRLASDAALPRFYRDTARRRIPETKRLEQGLRGRDPTAYRVQLPMLSEHWCWHPKIRELPRRRSFTRRSPVRCPSSTAGYELQHGD